MLDFLYSFLLGERLLAITVEVILLYSLCPPVTHLQGEQDQNTDGRETGGSDLERLSYLFIDVFLAVSSQAATFV